MERMNGETLNIVEDNIQKLKAIFPEVFNEDKVDFEKLEAVLGEYKDNGTERYNFSWPGKSNAIRIAQTPSTGTLRPCKEESKNWDETQNLYIEGDNLEVLKLLQKSYYGKVKMIYIDPPYNTGNDFVYKDDFKDNIENYLTITGQKDEEGKRTTTNTESNGRYHSNWLNMIYPRLKLARNLLRDDGVIFISIDDNEVGNLQKICNEIFGEDNFIGQITVVGNPRGRDYGGVARMHDYILAYSKTNKANINLIEDENNNFTMFDEIGGFELRELRNRNIKFNINNRPNLYYPFYINENSVDSNGLYDISLEPVAGWFKLFPLESQGVKTVWRWGKPKSLENLNINIKAKAMKNGSYQIVEKYRESKMMARSVWWDKNSNTEKGTLLLKELFNGKVFDYPKPVELIQRMIEMGSNYDECDIIMDFFSGSATTSHAVIKQNLNDSGNRKFIMIQLPEGVNGEYKSEYKTICDIGKERIIRAGEKIKRENKDKERIEDLDIGFKVFKLDSSNINKWDLKDGEDIETNLYEMTENIKEGRTEEDILYEILLKYGIDLNMPIEEHSICGKKVFDIGFGAIIACLDNNITLDVVEGIGKLKEGLNPEENECRVVFMDSGFATDSVKTNAIQILKRYNIENVKSI